MAISVTISDGQVVVCINATTASSNMEEISGPFTEKGAAQNYLSGCGVAELDNYAEVERLTELGVPFFISIAHVDASCELPSAALDDTVTDEVNAAVVANIAAQASETIPPDTLTCP